jgi:hypothetical protein
VGLGLLIALSAYASLASQIQVLEVLAITTPCVLLLLSFVPSTPSREYLIVTTMVIGFATAIWAFFSFISLAKLKPVSGRPACEAAASGMFFVFLGEGIITGAGFFLQTNLL